MATFSSTTPSIPAQGSSKTITPLKGNPCANRNPSTGLACPNLGISACGACNLASYCSKECQVQHWGIHKAECRDPIKSSGWKPPWQLAGRMPMFAGSPDEPHEQRTGQPTKSGGLEFIIWEPLPATNILNLSGNEGADARSRDLNLAFACSYDLSSLIKTVNSLPDEYSGHLTVLFNVHEKCVFIRDVIFLLILALEDSPDQAAELVLHLWYSAFIKQSHRDEALRIILPFSQTFMRSSFHIPLSERSQLHALLEPLDWLVLLYPVASPTKPFQPSKAERDRVLFQPGRIDHHHRHYTQMEPSHRLAWEKYRRTGVILPFGSAHEEYKCPNQYLFTQEDEWVQDDNVNPLSAWDTNEIMAAGKAHGVYRADIFGCFYFFILSQLRTFAERLKKFNISIHFTNTHPRNLPNLIRSGGLSPIRIPPTIKFDRIDIANLCDVEALGIPRVLTGWSSFINPNNPHATLLGQFLTWQRQVRDGSVAYITYSKDGGLIAQLTEHLWNMGWIPVPSFADLGITNGIESLDAIGSVYNNGPAFRNYMDKQEMETVARLAGLKIKDTHTVVPRRVRAPLDGPVDVLPHFDDKEDWYVNVRLNARGFTERFVEFKLA